MSDFKKKICLEQEVTVEGEWKLPFDSGLLVQMINYNAAKNEEELEVMSDPKTMIVRITISTKEI